jgi:hypothetical protein
MSKDSAVWVGLLIDRPPINSFVLGQLAQYHFVAGFRDEVRRAGHSRLERLQLEKRREITSRTVVICSRLIEVATRRIHDGMLSFDTQQNR